MNRSNTPSSVEQFAGLTRHNRTDMSDRAASIAGLDADTPPDTSFATAVRNLETAGSSEGYWKLPDATADHVDLDKLNDTSPTDIEAVRTEGGDVLVKTGRFSPLISPDKVNEWTQGEFEDDDGSFRDALWHFPTKTYSVVNPLDAYEPLETAIRDEDLGDEIFGEVREYKGGGEVHMDILFDNYQIGYTDDEEGRDPITLGIRTGYDFFGGTALYFEGFAQDSRCDNSIRNVTDEKVFRHVGEIDLEEEISEILEDLGVMTNQLAELIELADDIDIELLDLGLAEPMDHNSDMQALYELVGFPSYLAQEAATHARNRADNQFMPTMTDVWDGATYALTHHFQGGENTSTAESYIDMANDFVMNPSQAIGRVQRNHRNRLAAAEADGDESIDVADNQAHAKVTEFSDSISAKADEFESRNAELRQTLLAENEEVTVEN